MITLIGASLALGAGFEERTNSVGVTANGILEPRQVDLSKNSQAFVEASTLEPQLEDLSKKLEACFEGLAQDYAEKTIGSICRGNPQCIKSIRTQSTEGMDAHQATDLSRWKELGSERQQSLLAKTLKSCRKARNDLSHTVPKEREFSEIWNHIIEPLFSAAGAEMPPFDERIPPL